MLRSKEFYGEGKEIWQELEKIIAKGYNNHQVFEDWLDLTLYQLQHPKKNEDYLKIMKTYNNNFPKGQRPADHFFIAGIKLMEEVTKTKKDILGNIFEQKVSYGNNGQFLTPEPICELLVHFNKLHGKQNIADPACGSGRILVAAGKINPEAQFYGKDIDSACSKMAALNFYMFQMSGWIEHGDTLRNTIYNVWRTLRTDFGMLIHQLNESEVKEYQKQQEESLLRQAEAREAERQKTVTNQQPSEDKNPTDSLINQPIVVSSNPPDRQALEQQLAEEFGINLDQFTDKGIPKEDQIMAADETEIYGDLPLFSNFNNSES